MTRIRLGSFCFLRGLIPLIAAVTRVANALFICINISLCVVQHVTPGTNVFTPPLVFLSMRTETSTVRADVPNLAAIHEFTSSLKYSCFHTAVGAPRH